MNPFPIDPDTLKTLHTNGHITDEALTAIAPVTWLATHYPELLKSSENLIEVVSALGSLNAIARKPRTCQNCIHFSQVHECCLTRIDEESSYLPVTSQTDACLDFEGVDLPAFVRGGEKS